eukprot:1170968-Prorocentrum_lima.AAC.1
MELPVRLRKGIWVFLIRHGSGAGKAKLPHGLGMCTMINFGGPRGRPPLPHECVPRSLCHRSHSGGFCPPV